MGAGRNRLLGSLAAVAAIGVIGYTAVAQTRATPPVEVAMPPISQRTSPAEAVDNSRECARPEIDSACVYL